MTLLTLVDRTPTPADIPPEASAGVVIALTPTAFESCRRLGLEPLVLDDLFDRSALLDELAAYTAWQKDWLRRVDLALGDTGAVVTAAYLLVTPIDSVVARARALHGAAIAVGASALHYVGRGDPSLPDGGVPSNLQFDPQSGDTPLAALLAPLLAAHLGVPHRSVSIDGITATATAKPATAAALSRLRSWTAPMVNIWRPSHFRSGSGSGAGATLMLWSAGYGARGLARHERARGREVLALRGGDRTELLEPHFLGFAPIGPAVSTEPAVDLRRAPSCLSAPMLELLGEVDEWAGIPGSGRLLTRRVATFASGIVPVLDAAADELAHQMRGRSVDLIAASNPHSISEFAVLLAGGRMGVDRLLLQHGDHLFPYDKWWITELQNFEHFWASDATAAMDLTATDAEAGATMPKVALRSPRVDQIVASTRRRSRASAGETVGYVPALLVGDSHVLGGFYFEDTWYHRWHRRLLTWMAAREAHQFVWKALPAADRDVDPIPRLIDELEVTNVRYETRPFRAVAHEFGRVITDFPSTALYEAVHLEHPVLALSFRRFAILRKSAAAVFSQVIRECVDEREALRHIEDFLGSPAENYKVASASILRP